MHDAEKPAIEFFIGRCHSLVDVASWTIAQMKSAVHSSLPKLWCRTDGVNAIDPVRVAISIALHKNMRTTPALCLLT